MPWEKKGSPPRRTVGKVCDAPLRRGTGGPTMKRRIEELIASTLHEEWGAVLDISLLLGLSLPQAFRPGVLVLWRGVSPLLASALT